MPTHKYQVGGLGSDAEAMSYQDMAREVYIEPEQYKKAEKEGWFEGWDKRITRREAWEAVEAAKKDTQPGESQLHINQLKLLGPANMAPVVRTFNTYLQTRRIPDDQLQALLRLLPKTDQGLSDLDKTRPIALLETLTKLYERIIITRVTRMLVDVEALDLSQYGALPKAGTLPPEGCCRQS